MLCHIHLSKYRNGRWKQSQGGLMNYIRMGYNWRVEEGTRHKNRICLTFLHCECSNVTLNRLHCIAWRMTR